jgi:hypothetical protein
MIVMRLGSRATWSRSIPRAMQSLVEQRDEGVVHVEVAGGHG